MTAFDTLVVGGGVMGATTALHLARAGMRVALIERNGLGTGASGVNAGTLSLQIKRAALVPYAIKGIERWRTTQERLGIDMHYRRSGGLTLAFTPGEAEVLTARMNERKAAGVPLEFVTPARARELEPGLSAHPVLASYCADDGYASSTLTGQAYRTALLQAGVAVHEGSPVTRIDRNQGFRVATPKGAPGSQASAAWSASSFLSRCASTPCR
jgi:glycine/D-amino acid oxidase-like deaminating enzyme